MDAIKSKIADNRWGILLLVLLATYILDSLNGEGDWTGMVLFVLTTALFMGVITAVDHHRSMDYVAMLLILAWIVLGTFRETQDAAPWVDLALLIVSACLLLGGLVITYLQLLAPATSDRERLFGAVFGYMLLAMFWALIYWRLELSNPSSFRMPAEFSSGDSADFFYYSLVTISTLGYGEITPITPIARTLAGLEAVTGTLYIAVLIGRIVGRI